MAGSPSPRPQPLKHRPSSFCLVLSLLPVGSLYALLGVLEVGDPSPRQTEPTQVLCPRSPWAHLPRSIKCQGRICSHPVKSHHRNK